VTVRTTATLVSGIRTIDEDDIDTALAPYILTASALVDDHCTSGDLDSDRLELIERWLAAHFYTLHNNARLTLSETIGPLTETYFGKVGFALNLTPYGQTAMTLDSTGGLALWNAKVIAGKTDSPAITWLGQERT
jgi:hypothetical protein